MTTYGAKWVNLHFKICLYNPYVIVHLKSLKIQIFRNGGSNILGVYQNKSDFFQVCEQVLLFYYYFGSVATHGHIASKRKRHATFASHPHTPRNREYSTARPARHIAREGMLPRIFNFMWDRSWANRLSANRTPLAAFQQKRGGEDLAVARKPRNLMSDGARW